MILSSARFGWQTTLADLALILFMVTAAAMAERPEKAAPVAAAPIESTETAETAETAERLPHSGEPLAIYRALPGAPPLKDWLESQPVDARQNLTIIARHPAGGSAPSARIALALADEAHAAGRSARIVIEPAEIDEVIAVLDFDGRQSGTSIAETRVSNIQAATAVNTER